MVVSSFLKFPPLKSRSQTSYKGDQYVEIEGTASMLYGWTWNVIMWRDVSRTVTIAFI